MTRARGFPERVQTPRLLLRRWTRRDGDALEAIWADPCVWASLRPGQPFEAGLGRLRLDHHLDHWRRHGFGVWVAEDRRSGEVAGWIGASHPVFVPALAARVEIGWTLRRPFWGQGLATEGAAAAAASAFAHLDVDQLISLIHASNARSVAVAERVGMRRAGSVRHALIGQDLEVYALSRPPRSE